MEHSIVREKVAQSSSPFPVIHIFVLRHVCCVSGGTYCHPGRLTEVSKSKVINMLAQLYSFSLLPQIMPALHGSLNKTDQEKRKLEKSAALCCAVGE